MKVLKKGLIVLGVIILIFAIVYAIFCGKNDGYYNEDGTYKHITGSHSYAYAINHPALDGFGQSILPWEDGFIALVTKPLRINYLMPMLIQGDLDVMLDGLNFVIDKANEDKKVFLDYYTQEDKASDPLKEKTGLIFIKGDENAPFALVCPGGAFISWAALQEGYPIAKELNDKGYNVFILRYRLGSGDSDINNPIVVKRCCEDVGAAISYLNENSDTIGITIKNYSVWGFSAGGLMVGEYSNPDNNETGYLKYGLPSPAVTVMGYPALASSFSVQNPPAYITMSADDDQIPIDGIDERVIEMKNAGIDVEYRRNDTGGHGFGVGFGTEAEGWIDEAIAFWEKYQH